MTFQNRVDPWGRLQAVKAKGAFMGNRGILHDDAKKVVRPWAHKAWVTCLLCFGEMKKRKIFSEGNYSELFFHDEPTALAAGHRPCNFCQRERFVAFKTAWVAANLPDRLVKQVSIQEIDKALHAERAVRGGGKLTYMAGLDALPRGAMFVVDGVAYLVHRDGFLPWSFDGYGPSRELPGDAVVEVLTPRSVVAAIGQGFAPKM